MKLLFVCTGNTCRSPMAMAICAARHPEYQCRSRGVAAFQGAGATEPAVTAAGEYGGSLADHKSALLHKDDLLWADRVYVMSETIADSLRKLHPEAASKISLLPCGEVEDPYGQGLAVYRRTAAMLAKGIDAL